MNEQSRNSFEEWAKKLYDSYDEDPELLSMTSYGTYKDDRLIADLLAWQASEARILALLDSEEMVEAVSSILYEESHWDDGDFTEWKNLEKDNYIIKHYIVLAKASLQAIKQKIGE